MAHVQIRYSGDEVSVVVDGVELAPSIMHEGFGIEFGDGNVRDAKIHMTLVAETLDVDLPDAEVIEMPRRLCDRGVEAIIRSIDDLPRRIGDAVNQGASRGRRNGRRDS